MLLKLKKKHKDLIDDITVEKFRREAHSYELIGAFNLCDGGKIFIRDYQFQDGSRKYSYQWQSEKGSFIGRWDNAPHWPEIESYPHHFHNGTKETVESSIVRDLDSLCEMLRKHMK